MAEPLLDLCARGSPAPAASVRRGSLAHRWVPFKLFDRPRRATDAPPATQMRFLLPTPPQGDFLLDQTPAFDPAETDPPPNFVFDQSLPVEFED